MDIRGQAGTLPFLDFGQDTVRNLTDHLCRQSNPVEILQLVMDVSGAHSPGIEGYDFILDTGNIPFILWDKSWLKLTIAVPWNIQLELPILALYCF